MPTKETDTTKQVEFFLVTNEEGDITGDRDADIARDRMIEDYGGELLTTHKMIVNVAVRKTLTVTLSSTEPSVEVS